MTTMYETPEGFTLSKPLVLPDVRDFAEVLTYRGEWDHDCMTSRDGKGSTHPELVPAPIVIGQETSVAALARAVGFPVSRNGNEIGPFCTIKAGGIHRSTAVVATPLVINAVRDRIVTADDHLSFSVITHAENARALVILNHGQIIGSHWLAYVDPATIPSYPYVVRDAAATVIKAEIESAGRSVMRLRALNPHEIRLHAFTRTAANGWRDVYHGDPITITPDGSVNR